MDPMDQPMWPAAGRSAARPPCYTDPMTRTKWAALLGVVVVLGAGGAYYVKLRGPSGATTALGGAIAAKPVPELPADANRWVNGAPVTLAGARGEVVFVEGWHPA
jgi:hypothetical protein